MSSYHSVRLTEASNGWSLSTLCEEALESNSKFVCRYPKRFSRRPSDVEELRDAILRFLERDYPGVIGLLNLCICDICHHRHKTENNTKYTLKGAEYDRI